ncbi:uncharacterized protein N7483_000435 [Penicillium malachiteum]|uniref:uncharacterized protein n=1 Tax=Penicillium malachiteum TaxID=1324776 RepID=UPI002548104D|nr:uncharacterized protein N7483_000435 [Penicillium malachiteum]KAJ5735310.1 hypothetical protein N7483_000435 [Penicillium malachiteum]
MDSIPLGHKHLTEDLTDHDDQPLLDDFESSNLQSSRFRTPKWLWGLHILLFILSFTILIISWRQSYPTDSTCAKQLSAYSPFTGLVEYETRRFHGALSDTNPYKGPPNPRLDAEWKRITHMGQLKISAKDMTGLRKPLSQVKVVESEGDGYAVGIEVFHQLHCLNLIRQYVYFDYYSKEENKPAEFSDSNQTVRLHIDHCIDILRQVIQCNGDVGVVTRSWVKGRTINYPDFNVWHKCRKLEPILQYAMEHEIEAEPVKNSDSVELSEPPCTNAAPGEVCP